MRNLVAFAVVLALFGSATAAWADGSERSQDGTIEVVKPAGWQHADIAGAGKIKLKSAGSDEFTVVVSEAKEDFAKLNKLDDYAALILGIEAKQNGVTDKQLTGPTKLKINGHDAIRYEIRGAQGGMRVVYLKTFLESDKHWNCVNSWTAPSKLDDARPSFDAIVNSFHELAKPAPAGK